VLVQRVIDYDGEESLLLNAKSVASLKDNKPLRCVVFDEINDSELKAVGEEETILKKQSGTYPKTADLYPKETPVFEIALSRSLLLSVLRVLDENEDMIRLYFYGSTRPVRFTVGEDVKGLIMPMYARVKDEDALK
jgi:DNA polymerase III sliding clamp (beta) subunit (PCNA family)